MQPKEGKEQKKRGRKFTLAFKMYADSNYPNGTYSLAQLFHFWNFMLITYVQNGVYTKRFAASLITTTA
jgi:hypothetical protein